MNKVKSIGWINGRWKLTDKLMMPINNRAVSFGDGIFETILIADGKAQLLQQHFERFKKGASILHMAPPPKESWLETMVNKALKKGNFSKGYAALRLNWSRSNNGNRGIDLVKENQNMTSHCFWLEINPITLSFKKVSTEISIYEKRNANSQINQCKSLNYLQSIQARKHAKNNGYDDALLESTNGEISCGTTANLIIKRKGELLTPRLESGCLPGIMRAQGLKMGLIKEAKISCTPQQSDEWALINSLGCNSIARINKISLKHFSQSEQLWRSLLNYKP